MTPKTAPPPTPLEDMIAAKAELRALEQQIRQAQTVSTDQPKLAEKADALRARIASAERAHDGIDDEGEPVAPPTLDDLRDERASLEAAEAEHVRAEYAASRELTLRRWASARASLKDQLAARARRDAERLAKAGAFDPAGLADLVEATTDERDKAMRAAIESLPMTAFPVVPPTGRTARIDALGREIAALEAEGQPTPYQLRQQRLQAAAEAASANAA